MSNSVQPHRRQPIRLHFPWDSPGKNTGVGCHFLLQCMKVKSESEVTQSCPTLSDPMVCSLPGSSIHGIFQARVLEWGAILIHEDWKKPIPSLGDLPDPGIKQGSSVLQVDSLPAELPGKPPDRVSYLPIFFFKIEFFKIVSALCSPYKF